ncbi:MAG: asparaginase [Pseudomonadota bacterium]|nr:asparaginase [Pseudomonadota bacterium]
MNDIIPTTKSTLTPLAVEVTRGAVVESRHRASCAVFDSAGNLVQSWGDVDQAVYPRSAIKAIQALPLVETGAAEAYGLGDGEIALACSSHGGEPFHVATVEAWLVRIGLNEADFECGAHLPAHGPSSEALLRHDHAVTQIHNNCSGKHMGFLTTACHAGEPTKGYIHPDHPVQQRISAVIAALSGVDLARVPVAVDGCGIPTLALQLKGLATAMARFADPASQPDGRGAAMTRIHQAIAARPEMVAGTGRLCTAIIRETGGAVLAKTGAEGVFAAALPGLGLGLAIKVDDGAGRASEVAVTNILKHLGAIDDAVAARLADFMVAPLKNIVGRRIGDVRPAATWPQ